MFCSTRRYVVRPFNPFLQLFRQQHGLARLAILQPGDTNAPLQVTLTDASLSDTSYEYLAYDRTKDEDKLEITVGDQTQAIPRHLETGLRTFRRSDRPRTIWADLLVDSSDHKRTLQASTMRSVLENADQTLCWTGVDNEKSAEAHAIIREMADRWTKACVAVDMPESFSRAKPEQLQGLLDRLRYCSPGELESHNFGLWGEIYNIFSSPYWTSVRCLPEIVLAKKATVVYGRNSMPWHDFQIASKALAVFQQTLIGTPLLSSVMKNIQVINGIDIAERRRRTGETIELLPMIISARDAHLEDPRDCVFSMLPIATPSTRLQYHTAGKPEMPDIDYSKSVQQVFTEATKYIISERQDLTLWWSERAPCEKQIRGLPSWVPDWSVGNGWFNPLPAHTGLRQWWESIKPKKAITISDDNALCLQAIPLDEVVYVSPLFHAGNCRRLAMREFYKLQRPTEETPEAHMERFWRTLMFDRTGYGETLTEKGKPSSEYGDSFQSLLAEEEILEKLDCTSEQLAQPEIMARVDKNDPRMKELFAQAGKSNLFETSLEFAWGHRFFITEGGNYGMTTVENYNMTDATYRIGEVKPETNTEPTGFQNIGETMSDPMSRSMMEGFQKYLQERDPDMAKVVSQVMRGEMPHQQEKKSEGVQVGDHIVLCIGSFHPHILRPKKSNEEATTNEADSNSTSSLVYEYVGDSYLNGIMDGECFINTDSEGRQFWATDTSLLVDISIV